MKFLEKDKKQEKLLASDHHNWSILIKKQWVGIGITYLKTTWYIAIKDECINCCLKYNIHCDVEFV